MIIALLAYTCFCAKKNDTKKADISNTNPTSKLSNGNAMDTNSNCSSYEDYDSTLDGVVLDANSSRSKREIIEVVDNNKYQLSKLKARYPNANGQIVVSIGINSCGIVDACSIGRGIYCRRDKRSEEIYSKGHAGQIADQPDK